MLRFRSRAVTLMAADHQSSAPASQKPNTKQIPSLLSSPRLRALFVTRAHHHATYYNSDQPEAAQVALSPISILDTNKPFSAALGSPIWYEVSSNYVGDSVSSPVITKPCWETSVVGLNSLILDNFDDPKPKDTFLISKFRSNLKVQIPLPPNSPTDFGTKTWRSPKPQQLPLPGFTEDVALNTEPCLLMREMELSEDYTCVISHGPNPTTTHIFDNRVVDSCLFYLSDDKPTTPTPPFEPQSSDCFLSACFCSKKSLNQNQDIYIYRGDKAFCSSHCRYQEMVLDGAEDEEEDEDNYSH